MSKTDAEKRYQAFRDEVEIALRALQSGVFIGDLKMRPEVRAEVDRLTRVVQQAHQRQSAGSRARFRPVR